VEILALPRNVVKLAQGRKKICGGNTYLSLNTVYFTLECEVMASKSGYELLGFITQLGLIVVTTVGLAGYAGSWLDDKLGTGAVLTGLGVLFGIAAAYYSVYTTLEVFFKEKGGTRK